MNQEMVDYIKQTPIEEIIRREDFVQLGIERQPNSGEYWIVTLRARLVNKENRHIYETAWGTFVTGRYYIFYKEV
jgi:hypothetical protein